MRVEVAEPSGGGQRSQSDAAEIGGSQALRPGCRLGPHKDAHRPEPRVRTKQRFCWEKPKNKAKNMEAESNSCPGESLCLGVTFFIYFADAAKAK